MSAPPPLADVATALCQARGFDLIRAAGSGAFKSTFLVRLSDGQEVALKLYPHDASDERSARETEAMLRCVHPNIAKLIEINSFVFSGNTHKYTLEEFIPGGTLSELIVRKGAMPAVEVRAYATPLIA